MVHAQGRFSVSGTVWLVGICRFGSLPVRTIRYGTVGYGTVRYGTVWYTVPYGAVQSCTVQYRTVRYGGPRCTVSCAATCHEA